MNFMTSFFNSQALKGIEIQTTVKSLFSHLLRQNLHCGLTGDGSGLKWSNY